MVTCCRAELGEYCLREKFEADCSGPLPTTAAVTAALDAAQSGTIVDGRILMRSAQYGRPHLGRCVQRRFPGLEGCAVDVLRTLDHLCSGRRHCSVDVFQTLGSLKPCSEIESFLKADFICVPGKLASSLSFSFAVVVTVGGSIISIIIIIIIIIDYSVSCLLLFTYQSLTHF